MVGQFIDNKFKLRLMKEMISNIYIKSFKNSFVGGHTLPTPVTTNPSRRILVHVPHPISSFFTTEVAFSPLPPLVSPYFTSLYQIHKDLSNQDEYFNFNLIHINSSEEL